MIADDLPPLLHPDVLMDLEGYTGVGAAHGRPCAPRARAAESVLATLVRDAICCARWTAR